MCNFFVRNFFLEISKFSFENDEMQYGVNYFKKEGRKIFFYQRNDDIRHPVQLFLLTCVEKFIGLFFQRTIS